MSQEPALTPEQIRRDQRESETLERICAPCHGLEQVRSGVRTKEDWDETFNRMIDAGASGTDAEVQQAFDYVIRYYSLLNVNQAGASDLAAWLDVDESAAQAIVDYRAMNGAFRTFEDLRRVPGVDLRRLEARKAQVLFK